MVVVLSDKIGNVQDDNQKPEGKGCIKGNGFGLGVHYFNPSDLAISAMRSGMPRGEALASV